MSCCHDCSAEIAHMPPVLDGNNFERSQRDQPYKVQAETCCTSDKPPMSRKLALYFDGTWNKQRDRTNVFRLFQLTVSQRSFRGSFSPFRLKLSEEPQAQSSESDQIKYYHRGVGVHWGEKILGGAFGFGLSRNIKEGYLWLAQHYQPGDDVFVFGFSRGAYTARSLVGLIRKCGFARPLPLAVLEALTKKAYEIYREKQWLPDGREADAFRKTYSWPETRIKFLGVWDTVGALGLPVHQVPFSSDDYRWHDTELSRMVENAYHAMALDEHRPDFNATVWSNAKQPAPGQAVEQRWFAGAHADVGGGYRDGKVHLLPLRWMQEKAKASGLKFGQDVQIEPDAHLSPIHDSLRDFALGLYAKLPWIYPNNRRLHLGINETIDDSVWARIDSDNGRNEDGQKYSPPPLAGRPR